MSSHPLVDDILRRVARRYRLAPLPRECADLQTGNAATALALAIDQARRTTERGEVPATALKRDFTEALARLIHEALREESGDQAFKAMALRHRVPTVREYASLSAHAGQDRRTVRAAINAMAHPAKQQRTAPGPRRDILAQLHAAGARDAWSSVHEAAQRFLRVPGMADESPLGPAVNRLLGSPALERLRRLQALASDDAVHQYLSLWERHGPRSGSRAAAAQGMASQRRGVAVEAAATRALEALARRLDEVDGRQASYRVVTSMRVPPSIPADPDRAKTEWDVVLLRRPTARDAATGWDVCLLVEAKASVDAATTDLPRLLRGLRLLAQADETAVYPFETRQGVINLNGASLAALPMDPAGLAGTILYCCDAPAETPPRLLGAASRMQLLSADASLEFAAALARKQPAGAANLEPVWHRLLQSPRWRAVLDQYPRLYRVRELMVHTDDLLAAVGGTAQAADGPADHARQDGGRQLADLSPRRNDDAMDQP
ncbi:3-deoxy-D-arabino-heptulosonate 7-phosphate synthase [Bordetella flabilis]|uniref:3-deoxy-D-arabino-heptulosonate 7-phosphate synthase n=1 Tax=Bordetella flabilis TaxID=463014 RepID=A0A193G8R1_9BORD|nr:3-deoxy-D-arabino-heptulosonate 7-phosphate synthase [Bordetella flabilis]ANN76372.1 3-deoxy-D-arabino-heptulosonate 7-phosphate synthase [Bordetella flabilis]